MAPEQLYRLELTDPRPSWVGEAPEAPPDDQFDALVGEFEDGFRFGFDFLIDEYFLGLVPPSFFDTYTLVPYPPV